MPQNEKKPSKRREPPPVLVSQADMCRVTGLPSSEVVRRMDGGRATRIRVGSTQMRYSLEDAWRVFGGRTNEAATRDRLRRDLHDRLTWIDVALEGLWAGNEDERPEFMTARKAIAAACTSMATPAWSALYRRAYGRAPHPRGH